MDNWSSNLVPKISLLPSHPRAMLREKERSWEPGLFALVLVESGSFRFCCRSVPRRPTYVEKNFPRLHISFSVNSVMSLKLFFLPNIRFCSFCSIRSIKWSIHQYFFRSLIWRRWCSETRHENSLISRNSRRLTDGWITGVLYTWHGLKADVTSLHAALGNRKFNRFLLTAISKLINCRRCSFWKS